MVSPRRHKLFSGIIVWPVLVLSLLCCATLSIGFVLPPNFAWIANLFSWRSTEMYRPNQLSPSNKGYFIGERNSLEDIEVLDGNADHHVRQRRPLTTSTVVPAEITGDNSTDEAEPSGRTASHENDTTPVHESSTQSAPPSPTPVRSGNDADGLLSELDACTHFTREQLRRLLSKRRGALNAAFQADSIEEAALGFVDLLPEQADGTAADGALPPPTANDALEHVAELAPEYGAGSKSLPLSQMEGDSGEYCDRRCARIRAALTAAAAGKLASKTRGRQEQSAFAARRPPAKSQPLSDAAGDDDDAFVVHNGRLDAIADGHGRPCALTFVPIARCLPRGSPYDSPAVRSGGAPLSRLCSACAGVLMLSDWCFPRYYNVLACNTADKARLYGAAGGNESTPAGCIYSADYAHGVCEQRTLPFVVLRNVGSAACQRWRFETLPVPVGCECMLRAASWLHA